MNTRKNSDFNIMDQLLNEKSVLEPETNEEIKSPMVDETAGLFSNFSFVNPPQDELELKEQFDNFIE